MEERSKKSFGFKELVVWQKAVDFADLIISITNNLDTKEKHYRLQEQIEAAAASVACNIAEGKGRNSKKEFIQYLYIARGSLYETITLATVFHKRNWISDDTYQIIENNSFEIASMIKGLINSLKKTALSL